MRPRNDSKAFPLQTLFLFHKILKIKPKGEKAVKSNLRYGKLLFYSVGIIFQLFSMQEDITFMPTFSCSLPVMIKLLAPMFLLFFQDSLLLLLGPSVVRIVKAKSEVCNEVSYAFQVNNAASNAQTNLKMLLTVFFRPDTVSSTFYNLKNYR